MSLLVIGYFFFFIHSQLSVNHIHKQCFIVLLKAHEKKLTMKYLGIKSKNE